MIEIEIDGKVLQAQQGAMIIEVADQNNLAIPRFCYHKKLSVAANCRMCLVEVEKMPKTVPACATPVTPGMKVFTKSQKALDSQRAVMEFLLINHPLDCPICDQGGECELQDNALGYGLDRSPYEETKRVVQDEDIGSLVATDLTRCIQCTRCVRFGQEIAGLRELGMTQRGESSEIRTFVRHSLSSEVSANIIDLCPVGALTSKPFRFTARAWELDQHDAVAPHDALGSNIHLHTRRGKLMRVVPKENESINEIWLSDRDRFSYLGLKHQDRLLSPMLKRDGQWHATDWETALSFAGTSIHQIKQKFGANALLALSSPSATQEEYALLAKLWKALGATDCSFFLRTRDVSDFYHDKADPHFGAALADIEQQKSILLVGSEVHKEIPLLGLRFRKAMLSGAQITTINPCDFSFNFNVSRKFTVLPHQLSQELAAVLKALLNDLKDPNLSSLLETPLLRSVTVSGQHRALAAELKQTDKSFIYLGAIAYHSEQASVLRLLVRLIAQLTGAKWGMHTDGANSMGLSQIQRLHDLPYQSFYNLSKTDHKAILLHNIEPELDCTATTRMRALLSQAECVVALTPFKSKALLEYAHVLLPIASLGETSGTFVNMASCTQTFKGYLPPMGESRPAWKVIRVLANLLGQSDFTYTSTQDIYEELVQTVAPKNMPEASQAALANVTLQDFALAGNTELYRVTQYPLYQIDNLVRRSEALQTCGSVTKPAIYLNQKTLDRLQLSDGAMLGVQQGGTAHLPVCVDATILDDAVFIPAGFPETAALDETLEKCRVILNGACHSEAALDTAEESLK